MNFPLSFTVCSSLAALLVGACIPMGDRAERRSNASMEADASSPSTPAAEPSPAAPSPAAEAAPPIETRADRWYGVIGTGQSLSVGTTPVNAAVNEQPFENLMLSLGNISGPPFDPSSPELSMALLVEPQRTRTSSFPSPYPRNLYGETPHGAMAAQVSALVEGATGEDYTTVQTIVGESGQGMVALRKDPVDDDENIGRAYAATLFEVEAIQRLATEAGKTYEVAAIVMTHGETDSGNSNYDTALVQLRDDYQADIEAITGQSRRIPMIVSQQHAYGFALGSPAGASAATLIQWKIATEHPGDFICSGPKYQYPYGSDGIHMTSVGYEMLGEKYGQVYYETVVLEKPFRPLEPIRVTRDGDMVMVQFFVPTPPLVFDETIPMPHTEAVTEWSKGRGFELRVGGDRLEIAEVSIEGDTVIIESADPIPDGALVGYAVTNDGTETVGMGHRFGQLRDSDPFVGQVTQLPQPNYAVAFELPLD